MKFSRSQIIQNSIAISLVVGVFVFLYATSAPRELYLTAGLIVAVLLLILLANRALTISLDRKLPWLTHGNKRFYSQLGIGVLLSLVIINISYFLFKITLTEDPPVGSQIATINALSILILLPIISINFGIQFLKRWKNAQLASEEFQKESIKAELNALKNHLDPHFLFNNLNILSSLISKDQKQSQAYLEKFAEVYRIILQSSSEELVELKQELSFISAYMYLLEIRFEDTIQLSMAIDKKDEALYLPPLTLQMLIENSIKHNTVSEIRPLKIHVESQNGYISVKNNLQEKKVELPNSGQTGLENIKRRYSYFTTKPVEVIKNPNSFIVRVPLINISEI
ncbi:sensor histidine kinase [Roseivirga seohaensis]|uniref:sensor histidine kinase n=1 Tax=Roseivirga seohaensis TaxID=1914963 RepID=UPI003BA84275